ncbi:antitoxin [Rhodococcus sp. CSLK01-03]|uniref:Antitoxin n=1 Tax=Rhodococcus indonesiensis TaxID=3055869 RepID=A0ABT7RIE2_9NOCA|nr:antitoxin [Rhodococcus indonesiensis]MDM7487398.1 antitoxin [Rhodococcus indonesiensis]
MRFMDSVKGLVGKGKDYARKNPDTVNRAIDKAGDLARTKGPRKYSRHVGKAQDAVKKTLGTERRGPGPAPGPDVR